MVEKWKELPLAFDGHVARIVARGDQSGGWTVCTEVDGRQMGSEHFPAWNLVEHFRARMQRWLTQAEIAEREASSCLSRVTSAAQIPEHSGTRH